VTRRATPGTSALSQLRIGPRDGRLGRPVRSGRAVLRRAGPAGLAVVDYDLRWPQEFEALGSLVRSALGDVAQGVDHIGWTAVPGLAAKHCIDVQIRVITGDIFEYGQIKSPTANTRRSCDGDAACVQAATATGAASRFTAQARPIMHAVGLLQQQGKSSLGDCGSGYSGWWQAASTLLPSRSRTYAP